MLARLLKDGHAILTAAPHRNESVTRSGFSSAPWEEAHGAFKQPMCFHKCGTPFRRSQGSCRFPISSCHTSPSGHRKRRPRPGGCTHGARGSGEYATPQRPAATSDRSSEHPKKPFSPVSAKSSGYMAQGSIVRRG